METEKGYHGSKSIILTDNIVVKEQRVDGSCIGAPGLKKKLINVKVYSNGSWERLSKQSPF